MNVYGIVVHPAEQSITKDVFFKTLDYFDSLNFSCEYIDLYRDFKEDFISYDNTTNRSWVSWADSKTDFGQSELAKIKQADILYVQSPLWHHGRPAIYKSYQEHVFKYSQAFEKGADGNLTPDRLIGQKIAFTSVTSGYTYRGSMKFFKNLENMKRPWQVSFKGMGHKRVSTLINFIDSSSYSPDLILHLVNSNKKEINKLLNPRWWHKYV